MLWLWVAPLTLFGMTLALPVWAARGQIRILRAQACALLVQGWLADWILRRHPAGPMQAITLGHVVIARPGMLSPRLVVHELEHVRQGERWGPMFPLLYLGSSAWQWLRGRHAYRDNRFEIAARAAEVKTMQDLV
ncbi:MAG TPA: signal peptide prediction [Noviherbaspirillum sp.]